MHQIQQQIMLFLWSDEQRDINRIYSLQKQWQSVWLDGYINVQYLIIYNKTGTGSKVCSDYIEICLDK